MNKLVKTAVVTTLLTAVGTSHAAGEANHYMGLFSGTTNFESETETTFGVEYEYKINKNFGAGAVWERTIEGHDGDGVNVVVGSLFYHPNKNWRLGIGFGEEQIRGSKPKEKDLWRVSATYEYAFGSFLLAPTLAVDFIDGERATVAGLAIMMPF